MTAQGAVRALLQAHDLLSPRWAANEWLGALGDVSTVSAALAGGWTDPAVAARDAGWWGALVETEGTALFGYRVRWWSGRDLLSIGAASTADDARPVYDLIMWCRASPEPLATLVDSFDRAQLGLQTSLAKSPTPT